MAVFCQDPVGPSVQCTVGYEALYFHSVGPVDFQVVTDKLALMKDYPIQQGRDVRSVCSGGCHALASDVIEVARNGRPVRVFYLTRGTLMGPIDMDGKGRERHPPPWQRRENASLWNNSGIISSARQKRRTLPSGPCPIPTHAVRRSHSAGCRCPE